MLHLIYNIGKEIEKAEGEKSFLDLTLKEYEKIDGILRLDLDTKNNKISSKVMEINYDGDAIFNACFMVKGRL